MHEMGIILHMANMLDETAKEQNLTKIGSVTLEVGEVSGIMTDLFVDCWAGTISRSNTRSWRSPN